MKTILGTVRKVNGCNARVEYAVHFFNKKYEKRLKKMHHVIAHSEIGVKVGDQVEIKSCAPISKLKKYRVVSIKEGA